MAARRRVDKKPRHAAAASRWPPVRRISVVNPARRSAGRTLTVCKCVRRVWLGLRRRSGAPATEPRRDAAQGHRGGSRGQGTLLGHRGTLSGAHGCFSGMQERDTAEGQRRVCLQRQHNRAKTSLMSPGSLSWYSWTGRTGGQRAQLRDTEAGRRWGTKGRLRSNNHTSHPNIDRPRISRHNSSAAS